MTRTGLDIAVAWLSGRTVPPSERAAASLLRRGRLGLLCNAGAVTRDLTFAPEVLRAAGANLVALYGPEHGIRGEAPAGAHVGHTTDRRTGLPVWSLYGKQLEPAAEMLEGLDALLVDLPDVGARFYTYSSTLSNVMGVAKRAGIPVVILDRPNPIGGAEVEGPILEAEHASFVGLHPVPVRHGATLGELGRLWADCGAGEPPLVVRCSGWRRRRMAPETGLPWVPPSPAMPTAETALAYPGTCFLEGTNLSEGRGTACPFLWFGASWVDAEALGDQLNAEGLPGARFRPLRFIPTASKHAGETCAGCQLHILEPRAFRPVAAGVALLSALRHQYPQQFEWREQNGRYWIDLLAGTRGVREAVDAGTSWREIAASWAAGESAYRERLSRVMLYS
jgi:uncharacterized protein YbbC (DUF1343 family)